MGLYDATFGTLLIGIFFNTFLYGLVTYQYAAYYGTRMNDKPLTRYMVFFLFVLDTVHSGSDIYMAWYYAVKNFDVPTALAVGVWPNPFTAIGTSLVATIVQTFLGLRIWHLTNSKVLYGIIIILAIPSLVLGLICGTLEWIIHVESELSRVIPIVVAWTSISVFTDVFITITLVTVFIRSRTDGFRSMNTILNRLIRGAVQTGLFVTIFALGIAIAFIALPDTNLYTTFAIPIGRIYTNTLMYTLLSRKSMRVQLDGANRLGALVCAPADVQQTTLSTTEKVEEGVQESGLLSCLGGKEKLEAVVPSAV